MAKFHITIICSLLCFFSMVNAQEKSHLALDSPYASFVEGNFPFFSQTVDARHLGKNWPKDNLTPRGIILKLGHGYFACFDTDLLRVALVWKENEDGEYLEMSGMGPGSYRLPNRKASAGQNNLPKPIGTPLLANGIYPGWSVGKDLPKLEDPRERSIDSEEIGLGPVSKEIGEFRRVTYLGDRVSLSYFVAGTKVWDSFNVTEAGGVVRSITIDPHEKPFDLVIGITDSAIKVHGSPDLQIDRIKQTKGNEYLVARIEPSAEARSIGIGLGVQLGDGWEVAHRAAKQPPIQVRWPEEISTKAVQTREEGAFAFDEIGLPLPNPWKRNFRPSGFDFFSSGRAAVCTFDGDVWLVDGLDGDLDKVTWQRFASGLHEPIAMEIVDDEIYVFDRNGIWKIVGSTGEKSRAHVHENFCNLVPQTAETREFANDLYEKPGGGFYLCKGGQVSSTRGIANGTVVEVAADGKSYEIIATGLRMPYIGVDPVTGMVTASDQQGNWIPATPIHVVRKGEYYGFQPLFGEKAVHPQPIDEPEIWIPHFVNQSGASQVWLRDAKMGPLNDSLIHIGYNRPEIFKVYLDESGEIAQGAVAPVMAGFPSGLLKGRVHPKDGTLWLTGFKIWGTSAEQISGLYRVRPTGGPSWIPKDVRSEKRGILLKFDQPVDEEIATNLTSYTVDRWNYLRTHNYGSGHYQLDGKPGQETLPVASVTLSDDKSAVFLGIPDMQPVHSIRVTFRQPAASDQPIPVIQNAYLTVHRLNDIDLAKEGFAGDTKIDLTLKAGAGQQMKAPDPSVEIGKQAYVNFGCVACHTVDGSKVPPALKALADAGQQVVVGPGWKGLWGSNKEFSDGTVLKGVDEVYLRESIVDPARKVPKGFEMEKTGVGMASYLGVLKDHEIDSLILYIKSLAEKKKK